MNVEEYFNQTIEKANGKSSAFLIERCEKTDEHPYGIRPADPIKPDEIAVIALPGTVSRKQNLKACNGILKRLTNFVHDNPQLQGIKVRPVMAVCDFGKYFDKDQAKHIMLLLQNDPDKAYRLLGRLSPKEQDEITYPNYVKDIYNLTIKNRISAPNSDIRLPHAQALRNISKSIFVPYCWGAHTFLKLEQYMQYKLHTLSYNEQEKRSIQSQLLSVCYSPSCPIGISQSRMVSFASASDLLTKHNNYAKEYLNMNQFGCPDFGYLWLDSKEGNIFYCAQFNKIGVEGNPIQYRFVKIDSWDDLMKPENNETKSLGEHDFIGFEPLEDMSKAAQKIQHFANNVIVNGIKHAYKQPKEGYNELPNTRRLAANTPKDHWDLFQAYRMGVALQLRIKDFGKENIMQKSFAANVSYVTFD